MEKRIMCLMICLFVAVYISSPARGGAGCSSFYLPTSAAGVFGTNLDHSFQYGQLFTNKRNVVKTGWETGTTGKRAVWTSKYGSLTFNLIGYQMAWAGMNEAGLVISTMQLLGKTKMPAPVHRPQLSGPFWVQYQLDNCATATQVIASDAQVRIAPNEQSHYLVCDKAGNCAVIEFIGGKMQYHTGRTLGVNVLTNSVYEEAVTVWRTRKKKSGDSLRRFTLAADELGKKQAFAGKNDLIDQAFHILSLVSQANTAWSIVFANQDLQIYFKSLKNPHIRRIDLTKLDFSEKTPVRMLDVHASLTGDISARLTPYSHQAGLAQMRRAFHEFAPTVSESNIEALLTSFENFPYAEPKKNHPKKW